jgi:lipoprotein Spr
MKYITYLGFLGLLLLGSGLKVHAQQTDKAPAKSSSILLLQPKDSRDFLHKYVLTKQTLVSATAKTKEETTTTSIKKETKKESNIADDMYSWLKDKSAMIMDVMPNQVTNVMLYRFIDDWYGVRYRMGGTTKKGVDCSSFVQQLYKYAFGTDLLRTAGLQFESAIFIKNKTDLKEGDLVFFRIGTSRISHVGVYLNNNYFVHSASSKGVSIANLTNAYWSKYFAGGGRIAK